MLVHNFKRRLFSFMASTATLVVFSAMQLVSGEQCYEVMECTDSLTNIQGLSYLLNTKNWKGDENNVCPRSDPTVPHWLISVEDGNNNDMPFTNPTYCSRGVSYSPSLVCRKNGTLIFVDLSNFHNTRGEVTFEFTTSIFNTTISVKYANSSVFPNESIVYFNEGDTNVHFSYFLYSALSDLSMTVYHNGVPVTDAVNVFRDVTSCVLSTTQEQAVIFIVTIFNPTFAFAGDYELVVGDSLSAVVTLVANFSSPSPSASLVSPTLPSIIPSTTSITTTPDVSSSVTPPISPTNDNDLVGIISGSVVSSLVLLIVIVGVIVVIILAYNRYRSITHQDETDMAIPLEVLNNGGVRNEMVNENFDQSNTGSAKATDNKGEGSKNILVDETQICNQSNPDSISTVNSSKVLKSDGEPVANIQNVSVTGTTANENGQVKSDMPQSSGHTPLVVSDTLLSSDHTPPDTPLSSGLTLPVNEKVTEQDKILKIVQENKATLNNLLLLEHDKGTVLLLILQELREGKELSKDSIELLRETIGKLEDKQVIEDTDADEQSLEDHVYKSDDLQSVHESTEASAHQSNDSSSSAHQSNDSSSSAHQSHDPEDPTDQSNDPESPTDQSQELNSNNTILTPSTDGNQLQHDRSADQVEGGAADQDNHSSTINDNVSNSDDEDKSGCDS